MNCFSIGFKNDSRIKAVDIGYRFHPAHWGKGYATESNLACIEYAGLGVAVKDAHPCVRGRANYITHTLGGFGAVRELCDIIMQCQGTLSMATGASV